MADNSGIETAATTSTTPPTTSTSGSTGARPHRLTLWLTPPVQVEAERERGRFTSRGPYDLLADSPLVLSEAFRFAGTITSLQPARLRLLIGSRPLTAAILQQRHVAAHVHLESTEAANDNILFGDGNMNEGDTTVAPPAASSE